MAFLKSLPALGQRGQYQQTSPPTTWLTFTTSLESQGGSIFFMEGMDVALQEKHSCSPHYCLMFYGHSFRQVNRYYKDLGVFGGQITTIVTTACLIRPLCEAIFHFQRQVIEVFTFLTPKVEDWQSLCLAMKWSRASWSMSGVGVIQSGSLLDP